MTLSFLFYLIATAFGAIAAALVLADEGDFLGLAYLEWIALGWVFFVAAHWVPPAINVPVHRHQ